MNQQSLNGRVQQKRAGNAAHDQQVAACKTDERGQDSGGTTCHLPEKLSPSAACVQCGQTDVHEQKTANEKVAVGDQQRIAHKLKPKLLGHLLDGMQSFWNEKREKEEEEGKEKQTG